VDYQHGWINLLYCLYVIQEARLLVGNVYRQTEKLLLENKEKLRIVSTYIRISTCRHTVPSHCYIVLLYNVIQSTMIHFLLL